MMTIQTPKPWYREPWPWILMAGPAIVVVAGFVTAWLAVVSNDGLVSDDYYKQGLAINQRIARDQEAVTRGLTGELLTGSDGHELRLFLASRSESALPEVLILNLKHPTRAGNDQRLELKRDGAGFYAGRLTKPLAGRWHVSIEDAEEQWRLTADWKTDLQASLRLGEAAQIAN